MMAAPMTLGNVAYLQQPMMGVPGNALNLQLAAMMQAQLGAGANPLPADAFNLELAAMMQAQLGTGANPLSCDAVYGAGAFVPQPAGGKDMPELTSQFGSGAFRSAAGNRRSSKSTAASSGLDSDAESDKASITTLMIQNLPPKATRLDVQKELAACGFAHLYDFCHVPRSLRSGEGMGYAFVNFATPEAAAECTKLWQGSRRLGSAPPYKPLRVAAAAVQGFQANAAVAVSKKAYRIRNAKFRPHFGQ